MSCLYKEVYKANENPKYESVDAELLACVDKITKDESPKGTKVSLEEFLVNVIDKTEPLDNKKEKLIQETYEANHLRVSRTFNHLFHDGYY